MAFSQGIKNNNHWRLGEHFCFTVTDFLAMTCLLTQTVLPEGGAPCSWRTINMIDTMFRLPFRKALCGLFTRRTSIHSFSITACFSCTQGHGVSVVVLVLILTGPVSSSSQVNIVRKQNRKCSVFNLPHILVFGLYEEVGQPWETYDSIE